jgi:hypothetical protein
MAKGRTAEVKILCHLSDSLLGEWDCTNVEIVHAMKSHLQSNNCAADGDN